MAFGINREELSMWKQKASKDQIVFLTHYWIDERFPGYNTVTKVGCNDLEKLIEWGKRYNLKEEWIHHDKDYPHFDLFGQLQKLILTNEEEFEQLKRFKL